MVGICILTGDASDHNELIPSGIHCIQQGAISNRIFKEDIWRVLKAGDESRRNDLLENLNPPWLHTVVRPAIAQSFNLGGRF